MDLDLAMEFIDLCIDNYKNGGHSTTKEQEHRYYELKHQFQDDHEKARKYEEHKKVLSNIGLDDKMDLEIQKAFVNEFKDHLQNQKLRELIEKEIKTLDKYLQEEFDDLGQIDSERETVLQRLKQLLKESKE